MTVPGDKKGLILFLLILVIVAIVALFAFKMTGAMGIEDRFNSAVGLPATGEVGVSGFSVEGNPVLYAIVLVVLLVVGFVAYRYLPKPEQEPETGKKN